jgi:hypothetical protein
MPPRRLYLFIANIKRQAIAKLRRSNGNQDARREAKKQGGATAILVIKMLCNVNLQSTQLFC